MRARIHFLAAKSTVAAYTVGCVLSLAGCSTIAAPPVPLQPEVTARSLTSRSLQDPDIAAALSRMGVTTSTGWSLDALTVAAWSARSDIAVAKAEITTAISAEHVAGLVPNPTLNFDGSSFITNILQDPTVWVLSAALNYTIETGDKRRIRIDQARADTETRRWKLAELLWQARAELRRALSARDIAATSVSEAEDELKLRQEYLDWVETQIRLGIGIGPDRLAAQTNISHAQAQLRTARGELATAESQIAAAVGLAIENLPAQQLLPLITDSVPTPQSYDFRALRDVAIVNRLGVRHALADYAVTEQALRQAIAKQHPDINLGPGYSFDRGDHAITVAASGIIPLLHDESEAIAEAINVRATAAAQFQSAQSLALSEVDTATAAYNAAYAAWQEARAAQDLAMKSEDEVQRRLAGGAVDRGEVLTAQIALALARRATLDALKIVVDALGALEDSVQRPIWPASALTIQRPDTVQPE